MILLLIMLAAISVYNLKQFNLKAEANKHYAETIKEFTFKKLRFQKYQKINVLLSYLLLVTVIILMPKFFYTKNIAIINIFGFSHFLWVIYSCCSSQNG